MPAGLLIALMTGIPLGLFALGFFVWGFIVAGRARAARRWPLAPGMVMYSGLGSRRTTTSSGGRSTVYQAQVIYRYQVDGQIYEGDRLNFGSAWTGGFNSGGQARKVEEYPPGRRIEVHYNPADPTQAVLEPRAPVSRLYWLMSALMLVMTVMFSGGAYVAFGTLPI